MFVWGKDVYVAGMVSNGTVDVATFWKNGKPTALTDGTDGTKNARVGDILVFGHDVYVSGQEYDYSGEFEYVKPLYWKNGKAIVLNDGGCTCSTTSSITVSGNDVYVSGMSLLDYERYSAVYWKNGKRVILDPAMGSRSFSGGQSIFVSGKDVYLAGFQFDISEDFTDFSQSAKYWKNGVGTLLTNGKYIADAGSVFVANGKVYVSGVERNESVAIAKYWRDGKEVVLSDGSKDAYGNSIFVAPW